MIVPFLLLFLSIGGILLSAMVPGWSDVILLAGPCAVASALLLLVGALRRRKERRKRWVVLDGSNVMHWKDRSPDLDTVREVVDHLSSEGFTPGVVFDANVGYKVGDRFLGDRELAGLMGVPQKRIMVVPKGQPADPTILTAARDMNARIVTNDRFRDWNEDFPETREPGRLIRGGYRRGKLWLDLGDGAG
ncbi:MAG: hypothetical protein RH980_15210 [Roseovarius confluentis]|jgi:hypothetical protein